MKSKDWNRYLKGLSLKKMRKDQLLILLLSGILLLVIAIPSQPSSRNTEEETKTAVSIEEEGYTGKMEKKLEQILSEIEGAGEVDVMITLESTAEKIIEKDRASQTDTTRESGSQNGTRSSETTSTSETSVYGNATGHEEPYVSKEISPKVQGVLVVADGGDKAVVQQNIMEAVQALFDIDTHKIRIMKKNDNQSVN